MGTKEEALKELNLSDKEINVYLTSLMLGQSTANDIAKKANLNRVTTYDILDSLLARGFVSYAIKSGVKYFEAVEPHKFLAVLKEKKEKIEAILPELENLKATISQKTNVEVYEGIKGIKSIFEDILKEDKDAWFIGTPKLFEALEFYFPHFVKQKRKQGNKSRVIAYDTPEMRLYKRESPKKYLEMKYITQKLDVEKIIYGKKIAYLTFEEKNSTGILIMNNDVVMSERKLFELLWETCKE